MHGGLVSRPAATAVRTRWTTDAWFSIAMHAKHKNRKSSSPRRCATIGLLAALFVVAADSAIQAYQFGFHEKGGFVIVLLGYSAVAVGFGLVGLVLGALVGFVCEISAVPPTRDGGRAESPHGGFKQSPPIE